MIKKLLSILKPYIYPYRRTAFAAFLLSFVLAGIAGGQAKLIQPMIDSGLNSDAVISDAYFIAGILFALGILNFPTRYFHFYWMRKVGELINADMRSQVFSKMQRLPTAYMNQNKQGGIMSIVLNDVEIFAQSFRALIDIVKEPFVILMYLGIAIFADWQLTLVILVVVPMFILVFQITGKKVSVNHTIIQESRADLTHSLSEGVQSHKLTKAFNLQNFVLGRFDRSQKKFFDTQILTTKLEEFSHPLVELVGALAFSLLIVFASYRIKTGELTLGGFIQFIGAMALVMHPIRKFSQGNVKIGQAYAAATRIKEFMDLPEEVDTGTIEKVEFNNSIKVNNVTFAYTEKPVLKDFSLEIKKGQKIALVGLSGSGKSTLINLLLGLYRLENGSIEIDGVNIKDIKLQSLRSMFGLVSQDIFLFNDTIRENLTLGQKFTDEQIRNALEVSYAAEFVDRLPDGLDTIIGDRGSKLSGGQQQRLTIARAFLSKSEVLLFDEATSALDNESEKIVQKALEAIAGEKTVIAVAHRLSTIQDYDCIFVLNEGRLVEFGTHAELMQKAGEYNKLYELSQKS